jgi:hypothetical protein
MRLLPIGITLAFASLMYSAEELPLVTAVEFQPLAAQVERVLQSLDMLGEPLPDSDAPRLKTSLVLLQLQRV